ncbi:MAG TPA: glutamate synthase, partial [Mycobacterium sp.]|nr:glutamate synthase [Mycobacterium sp.]
MVAEQPRGDAREFAAASHGDVAALPDLLHGQPRAGPVRNRRPVYLDLMPPCNAGCPAGENIQ